MPGGRGSSGTVSSSCRAVAEVVDPDRVVAVDVAREVPGDREVVYDGAAQDDTLHRDFTAGDSHQAGSVETFATAINGWSPAAAPRPMMSSILSNAKVSAIVPGGSSVFQATVSRSPKDTAGKLWRIWVSTVPLYPPRPFRKTKVVVAGCPSCSRHAEPVQGTPTDRETVSHRDSSMDIERNRSPAFVHPSRKTRCRGAFVG